MASMTFSAKVTDASVRSLTVHRRRLDDLFIASSHTTDLSLADIRDLHLDLVNDPSHIKSRRHPSKPIPTAAAHDHDALTTGNVKKMSHIRDSGFVEDDDGLSGAESELTSSHKASTRPTHAKLPDDPLVFDESQPRKSKSKLSRTTTFQRSSLA